MELHKRIKKLRLEREWTQQDLADRIGVKQKQISSYETGISKPSTDVLIKMAEIFEVSVDSLLTGLERQIRTNNKIQDKELLDYFQLINEFQDEDKDTIKKVLDAFVTKNKLKDLVTK